MDRRFVYNSQIPLIDDDMAFQKAALVALGYLMQGVFGTSTLLDGLACSPTSPASMNVQVGAGQILSLQQVDPVAYGDLGTDSHQIVKQGLSLDPVTLNCPAPATSGFSIDYLIQIGFAETDGSPQVLQYYNPSDPSSPLSGQGGDGQPDNTIRADQCVIQAKAGIAAATGTQTVPSADPNFTGAWVVTVAHGQTSITSANIAQLASAPFIPAKLPAIPAAIQTAQWTSAADQGSANTYVMAPSPPLSAYSDGMQLELIAARATNTGASTFTVPELATLPILRPDGSALTGGEIQANSPVLLQIRAGAAYLLNVAWHKAAWNWAKEQILPTVAPSSTYSAGYRCRPLQAETAPGSYTLGLGSVGYTIKHTDNSSVSTYTIPPSSSAAWPIGSIIRFQNGRGAANLKVGPGSGVTLYWGSGNVGQRTIGDSGRMGIRYDGYNTSLGADEWWVIEDSGVS